MSADHIYCYDRQRLDVEKFLNGIGSRVTSKCPHPVRDHHALAGLEHVIFIVIDGHPQPVPPRMWDMIVQRGAIVIHVDDQYEHRLAVRHYACNTSQTEDK
jgi:hypothetical protein